MVEDFALYICSLSAINGSKTWLAGNHAELQDSIKLAIVEQLSDIYIVVKV